MDESPPDVLSRRKVWVTLLLALIATPVAFVYWGSLRRALIWTVVSLVTVIVASAWFLYIPAGRLAAWGALVLLVLPHLLLLIEAIRAARSSEPQPRKRYQRGWIYLLLILAVWTWGIVLQHSYKTYWSEAFYMPTGSMAPTLWAGDCFMVDKLALHLRDIRHGDVVAHRADEGFIYCRRVIGLPGDRIELRNEVVYRNGVLLTEPYALLEGPRPPFEPMINLGPVSVAEGEIFLLGDNRRNSRDSRYDGPYALGDVVGVARLVYWSREVVRPTPKAPGDPVLEGRGDVRWRRIGVRLDVDHPRP
jgi:signal peptidase I